MPTYDYQCDACGHRFEQFQSIKAPPVRKCPACSKSRVRRLIGTGAGIIFKGSGFYCTDYRSDSYKQAASKESSSGSSAESKPAESSASASSDKPAKAKSPKAGKK